MIGVNFEIHNAFNPLTSLQKQDLINFLYVNFPNTENSKVKIRKTIDYALKERYPSIHLVSYGGLIVLAKRNSEIIGALVLNKTGMDDIFPENLLVYLATDIKFRNKGIAREMIKLCKQITKGKIVIHIPPNNPYSDFLHKNGFNNRSLQMSLG